MWLAGLLSNLQKVHFKNIYKNEIFTESLSLNNKCGFHVNSAVTKTMTTITHLPAFVTKLNKTDQVSLERAVITDGLIP